MTLDRNRCYRALKSRDARFDGRFFTGVMTTGIYCRPICPAITPKLKNVQFFGRAAAAEEAGFRPCKRCRPETAPGTPPWLGTSVTVARALALIEAGRLDTQSVPALAEKCGVGARHLSRLFQEQLGASPSVIAQTRRVHFARQLIDQTALPMTEVAFAVGFASVRRFNDAIKKAFGRSPSELRKRTGTPVARTAPLTLRLPFRPPYDFEAMLDFLRVRATPGVEEVTASRYRRTLRLADTLTWIEITRGDGDTVRLSISPGRSLPIKRVADRARVAFDLDADSVEIESQLARDAKLADVVRSRTGVRVPGAWDGFELSVRAILGQQVSVRGATTLAGRLAERYGDPVSPADGLTRLFPTPESLATAKLPGMPHTRARAIRSLAQAVVKQQIHFDAGADLARTRARLLALPGIGPWTVEYIAMRALRDPDAFPASDLGLRKALCPGETLTATVLGRDAEAWRPWRAYAAMFLWQSLSKEDR